MADGPIHNESGRQGLYTFLGIQAGILLFAIAPVVIAVAAGQLGNALGCRVDESGAYPCPLWGMDIGEALYSAGVFGWLTLATLPAGALLWLAHIGYTVIALLRRRLRRGAPQG
jgi:hypothetical protein